MPRPKGIPKTGGRRKGSVNGASIVKAAQHVEKVKITIDRVLEEYGRIAFLDIGQAFDENGKLKPIHEMPEDIRRSLAGIEVVSYEEDNDGRGAIGKLHKIKIIDKRAALADVAKHLGMFIERIGNPDGSKIESKHEFIIIRPGEKPEGL